MSNLDEMKRFKLRHTSVLTPVKLTAALLALAFGTATVHGQTVNDVLDVFKEVVKQSKNRPGKVGSEKRENEQVKRLQTALSDLGYYKGASDGIYGPGTDRALVDFLKDHNFQGPRPGEADALNRMVGLAESEAAKGSMASKNGQPDTDQEPDRDANWVATYAEARGGCSYFDQVLAGAPAADGNRETGDPSDLFGKPVIDWIETDFNLLEQAYFSACGIRSGAADFEREQFRSNIIGNLKSRIEQAKADLAYQTDLEARKKQELVEGQAAEKLINAKFAELDPLIAACERQLTPSCFPTGSDALTTLKELTETVRLVKDTSTDYETKIAQMESRALDIRAQGYEASKTQDANSNLTNDQKDLEVQKKQDPADGQPEAKLIVAKLAELEPLITACERQLTPSCFQTGSDALATLKDLTEAARLLKDTSTDYGKKIYEMESRAHDIRAQGYEASKNQDAKANLTNNCGEEIAGRKLSDPVFDHPIIWFNAANVKFTLRQYACFFHGTEVLTNITEDSDGTVAFYIKEIRLEFVPTEISQKTGDIRYGIKKPVSEGGILALVRVQNGLKVVEVNNAEEAIGFMGELVNAYGTRE